MSWAKCVFLCVGIVCLSSSALAQSQLIVESDDWGFDGRVVPRRFNLLTLMLRNVSDREFKGAIRLQHRLGGLNRTGAEMVEFVTISPQSIRTLQFFPYINASVGEYTVSWGNGLDDRHTVDPAKMTAGARVLINDPLSTSGIQVSLPSFREDHFPAYSFGTDGLRVAVLDHRPRWQAPQREAFRDWLFSGGQLHVLHGPDGKFPELPIAEINQGEPDHFGSGRIYWHPMSRGKLDREFIKKNIFTTSQLPIPLRNRNGTLVDVAQNIPNARRESDVKYRWDFTEEFSLNLKDMINVRHSWGLIFLIAIVYVGIVFPGGWIMSSKVSDYRINLASLMGAIVVASFLFSWIGARGYGEATSTYSLAIARPAADGQWNIEQCHSAFVVDGGVYTLGVNAPATYSAISGLDSVDGAIDAGRKGRLRVDIPQFTFRPFMSRYKVAMPSCRFTVAVVQESTQPPPATCRFPLLKQLTVEVAGELPDAIQSAQLFYDNQVYTVSVNGLREGTNLISANSNPFQQKSQFWKQKRYYGRRNLTERTRFRELREGLIGYQLGVHDESDFRQFRFAPGYAMLALYADLPKELHTMQFSENESEPLGRQVGRVLYCFDIDLRQHVSLGNEAAAHERRLIEINGNKFQ